MARRMTGFAAHSWYHHGKFLLSLALGACGWAVAAAVGISKRRRGKPLNSKPCNGM